MPHLPAPPLIPPLQVAATVVDFLSNHSLAGLPVFFHGFSSGGTMSLKLPGYLHDCCGEGREEGEAPGPGAGLRIDGIVSVDAAPEGGFGAEDEEGRFKLPSFPPTLFVVMEVRPGAREAWRLGKGLLPGQRAPGHRPPGGCPAAAGMHACVGLFRLAPAAQLTNPRWGTLGHAAPVQRGKSRQRAPPQIEMLQDGGVPAEMIVVRAALGRGGAAGAWRRGLGAMGGWGPAPAPPSPRLHLAALPLSIVPPPSHQRHLPRLPRSPRPAPSGLPSSPTESPP